MIKHGPAAKETIDLKFRAVFSRRSATRLKRLSHPTPCSVGGFPTPREGLRVVLRHALAGLGHRVKIVLSGDISLLGSLVVPQGCLGFVPGDASTRSVHHAELKLRAGNALLGAASRNQASASV